MKKKAAKSASTTNKDKGALFFLLGIIVLTIIVFSNATKGEWQTNWDDNIYILGNPHVTNFSLSEIFTSIDEDNYHPLTTLSYAIEYKLHNYDARKFHLHNIILHLINIVLLYFLLKRLAIKPVLAIVVALLFAIHPMRVESVTWISERKDLLYSLFLFVSLIFYTKYINEGQNKKYYYYSLFAFLLSLFSKSQAVILTPILFLVDHWFKRDIKTNLLEKIPYILLSLLFGLLAVYSQRESGALRVAPDFAAFDRIFLTSYAVLFYIVKTIVPYGLSALYLYPQKINDALPLIFYVSFAVVLGLSFLVWTYRKYYKELVFGILFYLFAISVTLQIIPVGRAITSDRYSYLSSIGILLIVVLLIDKVIVAKPQLKNYFLGLLVLCAGIFAVQTHQRNNIWDDPVTLVTDAIEKASPNSMYMDYLYASRGSAKDKKENYVEANKDYDIAIGMNPNYSKALLNRALNKEKLKDFAGAKTDYDLTIKAEPGYTMAYYSRGTLKINLKDYPGAIADYDTVLKLDPTYAQAYNNRGAAKHLMGNVAGACEDWKAAASRGLENSINNVQKYCK